MLYKKRREEKRFQEKIRDYMRREAVIIREERMRVIAPVRGNVFFIRKRGIIIIIVSVSGVLFFEHLVGNGFQVRGFGGVIPQLLQPVLQHLRMLLEL